MGKQENTRPTSKEPEIKPKEMPLEEQNKKQDLPEQPKALPDNQTTIPSNTSQSTNESNSFERMEDRADSPESEEEEQ